MLFPTRFSATAMGICNIGARLATIAAPMIAEIEGNTPLWVLLGVSLTSGIVVFFLKYDPF